MGWCACGVPAHFHFREAALRSTRPRGGSCNFPNVRRYPGHRLDAVRLEPMSVEAGSNPLLLAVPGPLAPGRNRQHPPAPHRPTGIDPPGRRLWARWPVPGPGRGSRCASPRPERCSSRGIAELTRRAGAAVAAPASQTGRSNLSGAAAPPPDAAFASAGGRRGDVSVRAKMKGH